MNNKDSNAELMSLLQTAGQLLNEAATIERHKERLALGKSLEESLAECADATKIGYRLANQHIKSARSISAKARTSLKRISRGVPSTNQEAAAIIKDMEQRIADLELVQDSLEEETEKKRRDLKNFNITLFGRTMSGKSTLMEILIQGDGTSIGKGAQRTTQDVRSYYWKGLAITDVPGIAAYGGQEDENVAHEAARKADLILFLVSDSPQPEEARHLARLRRQGHQVLGIHNVRKSLKKGTGRKLFIRDQQKTFNPLELEEVNRQLNELTEQYMPGATLPLMNVHLLSKFEADRMEPGRERNELDMASRFWEIESKIVREVATKGKFLRTRSFLDLATTASLSGMNSTRQCATDCQQLQQICADHAQQLRAWRTSFKKKAKIETDRLVRGTVGSLRSQITVFVEQNYENQDLSKAWEQRVRSANIEQKIADLQRKLAGESQERLETAAKEMEEQARLVALMFQMDPIEVNQIHDTKKMWNWGVTIGGVALSGITSALLLSGVTLGWNPVGWALLGAGTVLTLAGLFGGIFKSREAKRREAVAKIAPQLRASLDSLEEKIRDGMKQWLEKLHQQTGEACQLIEEISKNSAQMSQLMNTTAESQNRTLLELNRQTLDLALQHIGREGTIPAEARVGRLPGQALVLTKAEEEPTPNNVIEELEALLNEIIIQAPHQPSPEFIGKELADRRCVIRAGEEPFTQAEREISALLASQLEGSEPT